MKLASSTLFFCVVALLALGMVMVCSASAWSADERRLIIQPIAGCLGLFSCGVAAALDYRCLKRRPWLTWVLYGMAIALLAVLFAPGVARETKGAIRWLRMGPLTVQPSEFAKLALIVTLAYYGDKYQRQMSSFWRGLALPGVLIMGVAGLVFFEPDVGTALLVAAVGGLMLLVAGVRWAHCLPLASVLTVGLALFLWQNPMRSQRLYSWQHLEETKYGTGMQAYHAMVALGSGGVTGVGLGDGSQKLGYVPELHTDFIFSVVGEELGLIATLLVLLCYVAVLGSGVYIATHARDRFGMLMATGITFLIAFQSVINIGVVTGSLPNKGLPLPFVSSGGSSLVVMLTAVGMLLSVARQATAAPRFTLADEELATDPVA